MALNVLHITYWYPNPTEPFDAIWIKNHICALQKYTKQHILHLQVKQGKFNNFRRKEDNLIQHIISIPTKKWILIELISAFLIAYYSIRLKINKRFEIVNFHVAYPNLVFCLLIKKIIRIPIIITEHWSAYHFNFGVKKELGRIKNIFHHNIPVISVSNALATDIKNFAEATFPSFIIPNVVNLDVFKDDPSSPKEAIFFMISKWKPPKNPNVAIKAFIQFNLIHSETRLIIAGYGDLWEEMKQFVKKENASDKIIFKGQMNNIEVSRFLNSCVALIHPSEYETFSVVCSEAICCGTPVIASNVGGIPEVVESNGILIEEDTVDNWTIAMNDIYEKGLSVTTDRDRFSKKTIGIQYFEVLKKVLNGV